MTERYEPPHRHVYRVTRRDQLGYHRGEMTLREGRRGTEVKWTVEIEAPLSLTASTMRQILVPKLQASLDVLERVTATRPPETTVRSRTVDDRSDLPGIHAALRDQGRRAAALLRRSRLEGHGLWWVLQVLEAAAERIAHAADEGHWAHPGWVIRPWMATQEPLLTRIDDYVAGATVDDPRWARCLRSLEKRERRPAVLRRTPWGAVTTALRAQLRSDYPNAVRATWQEHYRGRCDARRFRADELAISELIGDLIWTLVRADLRLGGSVVRVAERVLRPETVRRGREELLAGYATARREAFEAAIIGLETP